MNEEEEKKLAALSLKEVKEVLELCEVPYWLTLGTALGAYRDRDFCKGDYDDIDIGIHKDFYYKIGEITRELEMRGWKNWHNFIAPDEISPEHSFLKEGAIFRNKIDIFFYTPNPKNKEELLFRLWRNINYVTNVNPARLFKKFRTVEFYGEQYPIPHDIEDYFVCNYGENWRTPIPRTEWNYYTDNKSKKI